MNDCVITSRPSDTTAWNTGMKGGVCILLEIDWQIATKFSLSLSCDRDYAGESFRDLCSFEVTKHGFFGHFKDFLPRVNQALFTTAIEDDSMAAMIASWKDNVIEFVTAKLS